jgi:hypothetical protein
MAPTADDTSPSSTLARREAALVRWRELLHGIDEPADDMEEAEVEKTARWECLRRLWMLRHYPGVSVPINERVRRAMGRSIALKPAAVEYVEKAWGRFLADLADRSSPLWVIWAPASGRRDHRSTWHVLSGSGLRSHCGKRLGYVQGLSPEAPHPGNACFYCYQHWGRLRDAANRAYSRETNYPYVHVGS